MNPRIAKEIRTQAPVFGLLAACAVAMVAVNAAQAPYRFIETQGVLIFIYFVGCILMAAMTFGNEFHLRTMSLLLSQPVARRKLWPEKMRVLTIFSVSSAIVTFLALVDTSTINWYRRDEEIYSLCGLLVFLPVLFCCTTPYFTLASKSTLGGIVFTLFASGMLYALSGAIWDQLSVIRGLGKLKDNLTASELDGPTFVFVILFIPYAALLYWLGRRRFLRLEVIDSQSLEANLPQGLETTLAGFSARFRSPFSRLLFKELRLQRISLMLTGVLCLFMIIECFTWRGSNDSGFVVAGTLSIYVVLFPILVCATAVAEEKTWGMKDWHLALPPSLNQQWRVKWLVAFTLSLVLGGGLTWLLAHSGPWRKELGIGFEPEMLCYPLLIAVALYAGSISTSTIRAFLITFGMIAAYFVIIGTVFGALGSLGASLDLAAPGLFAIFYMLAQLYMLALRMLSTLLVWPVYLLTQSQEKAGMVARWADIGGNKIRLIFLCFYVAWFLWLMLRFARTNYRHSDLAKGKIVRQLIIMLAATILLAVAIAGARHVWHSIPVF